MLHACFLSSVSSQQADIHAAVKAVPLPGLPLRRRQRGFLPLATPHNSWHCRTGCPSDAFLLPPLGSNLPGMCRNNDASTVIIFRAFRPQVLAAVASYISPKCSLIPAGSAGDAAHTMPRPSCNRLALTCHVCHCKQLNLARRVNQPD